MKTYILSTIVLAIFLAGCSSAYRQSQTPDDVYYSPAKEVNLAKNTQTRQQQANSEQDQYEDYTSSSDDRYLRMKAQNNSRWSSLDDYDYWNTPNYAYNNYYGYNSYNPYAFNNWGLSFYYSPFASIQPFGWYNNYYPSYSYYPSYGGYYGHGYNGGYGYGYGYGYTPVYIVNQRPRYNVSRPMLGAYSNRNGYSNGNNRNAGSNRYVPANNSGRRYNNSNNSVRYNNNNANYNNNRSTTNNSNTNTPSTSSGRSYTPSSSGSSSSGGGGVSRQGKH